MVRNYVIEKCEKEGFILLEGAEMFLKQYEDSASKEQRMIETAVYGDELISSDGSENDFKLFDDINTFKNVMTTAEITSYKGINFKDMEQDKKTEIMDFIIENLGTFRVEPISYKREDNTITVAWYLNDIMNTFGFYEDIESINHR